MNFLDIYKHLLPRARAWKITVEKTLRSFFEGLTGLPSDIKDYFDLVFSDIDPAQTRELSKWEMQFGLPDVGLPEAERRVRLDATWKARGGQDPRYIQDTLQASGFDVFVHEWWIPGTEADVGVKACATPRNPFTYLRDSSGTLISGVDCGEALAQCGEAFAEAGNTNDPKGYPLVNKILITLHDFLTLCGEAVAECGEVKASCGNFLDLRDELRVYQIPTEVDKWPYFLYIGAEIFGEQANVASNRRDEFENLCLKICPTQQWLGILVRYI